ncbi:hypothetical protein SAMD00019534_063140 [Acytostelium subglobosum LB1]|uniref:hypothetical protein n=1 Tax=Acytostelium subglobosum LB1 TaxID=1410327 RepID=UPI00064522D3|nr:hypothetical protein SAMD00019534_063140 [Acytostelium subglobosum LB1]GAM23139.1 hypothetical protein SAMD00019534_063140 [Acytostelium subglobosum LB1]|eukprot:XP_012753588.1 hypothetical protein SAMD00019534_063140 [Acytostelium subglobosum LB1]
MLALPLEDSTLSGNRSPMLLLLPSLQVIVLFVSTLLLSALTPSLPASTIFDVVVVLVAVLVAVVVVNISLSENEPKSIGVVGFGVVSPESISDDSFDVRISTFTAVAVSVIQRIYYIISV